MRNLEFINMPDYFTRFLKADMQVGGRQYMNFKAELFNNKSLNGIFRNGFKDIDQDLSADAVVNSMGWEGFRNRLAAYFIQYNNKGHFDSYVESKICAEILHLEQQLKVFSVSGYSRGFLLGFYLKLWSQHLAKNREQLRMTELLDVSGTILEILQKSRSRIVEIDWVVIIISQLLKYLNKDLIIGMFSQETEYNELFQILDEKQREDVISNLLNYGSSINDDTLFLAS